ncbi:hypothetical protein [Caballeronia sp. AZ7_KS35]|uniref:hypothetical protein n=1 Tax=Caballeronia sp. AZ7_KS35 TaxID=2921762 RepID=UPI0020294208|nr:hypothetical protein [Caballeronia sp. AZ7_KS35]
MHITQMLLCLAVAIGSIFSPIFSRTSAAQQTNGASESQADPVSTVRRFVEAVQTGDAKSANELVTYSGSDSPGDVAFEKSKIALVDTKVSELAEIAHDEAKARVRITGRRPDWEATVARELGDGPERVSTIPLANMVRVPSLTEIPLTDVSFEVTLKMETSGWKIVGTKTDVTQAEAVTTRATVAQAVQFAKVTVENTPFLAVLEPASKAAREQLLYISNHNSKFLSPVLNGISRTLPKEAVLALDRIAPASFDPVRHIYTFIARIKIHDAYMLRARVKTTGLSSTTRIGVWGSNISLKMPVSRSNADANWTPIVAGDTLWIQIDSDSKNGRVVVDLVMEMFELGEANLPLVKGSSFQASPIALPATPRHVAIDSSCKNDTNTQYRNASDFVRKLESATVLLSTIVGRGRGTFVSGFCTGTRIASLRDPNGFYILTANHCFVSDGNPPKRNASPEEVSPTEVIWDYRTTTCNASGPVMFGNAELLLLPRSREARLLAARFESDAVLFKVTAVGGERTALGWQLGIQLYNDYMFHRVSHPGLLSQSYSRGIGDFQEHMNYCSSVGLPKSEYLHSLIAEGNTEPGSSGSAIVTQNLKIIGQLYGNCYVCRDRCFYVRVDGDLSRSWSAFSQFLQ